MTEGESAAAAGSNYPAGGEDGNRIFTGHSFYVSRTVPSRDRFCKIIEANGGKITQIDSKAEFVIVDHLRQGNYKTPVYSYKFLEDCEKNKRLEDIEKYLVVEAKRAPQKGDSPTRKNKKGRVSFTDEDDQILLNWINRPGLALSGNKVYQELEARFPQHTYQAWRGRWLDQLKKIMPDGPRPTQKIDFDDFQPTPDEGGEPYFSRADDEILMDMKDEIIQAANEKAVYKKIQRQHPHHSDIQWRNRFTTTLLPLINKREVEKLPVQEGEADDVSPRLSEALSEEQPDLEAVIAAEQQPADEPPPSPEPASPEPASLELAPAAGTKASNSRQAADHVASYSTMGQALSTPKPAEKAHRARHSLRTGEKAGSAPPSCYVNVTNGSSSHEQGGTPHTPPHHETQLLKPPRSPKGHPTRDLTISPRPKTEPVISPAPQHVRVQQWRADVSRHSVEKEIEDDSEVLLQIKNEISENSPQLPSNTGFQAGSPSSALDRVVDNKRKRGADVEPVTPRAATHKRLKAVKQSEMEVPSTPEPETAQSKDRFPSTPPARPGNVRQPSPTFSDPDSLKPAPPTSSRLVSSAVKVKKSYHEMTTQAIYDSIPDDDEEPLVNEDIPGLGDIEEEAEEDDEDDFAPQKVRDEDVFGTSKKKANDSKGENGKLNFQAPPPAFDMDLDGEEESELDEEAAKRQEEELANYLAEKAAQYGVGKRDVIEAIERTSGDKALVDVVLDWKVQNKGFPAQIPGVWSVQEDKILLENNAKLIMQLEKKHGDRVMERIDWLQKWQDA
ncbi:hypothetical protein EV426DRAFT_701763 [Tirmania nivea]|nr:hypothetical protein EV426DRAFT_701763 [Tirmania nivea]